MSGPVYSYTRTYAAGDYAQYQVGAECDPTDRRVYVRRFVTVKVRRILPPKEAWGAWRATVELVDYPGLRVRTVSCDKLR